MKYLILAVLLASSALAETKTLTWSGNNPPGSVNYVLEINQTNANNEDAWTVVVTTLDETYTYDESDFGRTYYRVWAETLTVDPETNQPIRSVGSSNVVSTVVRPFAPSNLED